MVDFYSFLQWLISHLCTVKNFMRKAMDLYCHEQKADMCLSYREPIPHYFVAWKLFVFQLKSLHCCCTLKKNPSISKSKKKFIAVSNSLCSILCTVKNFIILGSDKHAPLKKNSKVFKRKYLCCFSFYRETKKVEFYLPLWTFLEIFSKISWGKWLSLATRDLVTIRPDFISHNGWTNCDRRLDQLSQETISPPSPRRGQRICALNDTGTKKMWVEKFKNPTVTRTKCGWTKRQGTINF